MARGTFGSEGGVLKGPGGVWLVIPPGALPPNTTRQELYFSVTDANAIPPVHNGELHAANKSWESWWRCTPLHPIIISCRSHLEQSLTRLACFPRLSLSLQLFSLVCCRWIHAQPTRRMRTKGPRVPRACRAENPSQGYACSPTCLECHRHRRQDQHRLAERYTARSDIRSHYRTAWSLLISSLDRHLLASNESSTLSVARIKNYIDLIRR